MPGSRNGQGSVASASGSAEQSVRSINTAFINPDFIASHASMGPQGYNTRLSTAEKWAVLQQTFDPDHATKERAEVVKNAALKVGMKIATAVLIPTPAQPVAKIVLGQATDVATTAVRQAAEKATQLQWPPTVLDAWITSSLPEHRDEKINALYLQVQLEELQQSSQSSAIFPTDVSLPILQPDATLAEKKAAQHSAAENNLEKLGLSHEQAQKVVTAKMDRLAGRVDGLSAQVDSLENLNQQIVSVSNATQALLQEMHDQAQRDRAWAGVQTGLFNLGQLAKELDSRELQIAVGSLQLGMAVQQTIDAITGFSASLEAIGPMAVLGPVGMAAGVFTALMGLFASPGPNPHVLLMNRLNRLSEQMAANQKILVEGMNELHHNQIRTLQVMVQSFMHLERHLDEKITGLSIQWDVAQRRIETSVDFALHFAHQVAQNQFLQDFFTQCADVNLTDSSTADAVVRQMSLSLETWLLTLASNPILTGRLLQQAHTTSAMPIAQEIQLLKTFISPDNLDNCNAVLAWLLQYHDELRAATIPNPLVWQQGVVRYIRLQQRFPALDTDIDDAKLKKLVARGEGYLQYLNDICADAAFWRQLWAEYQAALQSVKSAFLGFGAEISEKQSYACNQRLSAQEKKSDQTNITQFDILASPAAFIEKFQGRTLNAMTSLRTTHPHFKIEKFSRIYEVLKSQLSATLLCAEWMGLKQFAVVQNGDVQGINLKEYSPWVRRRRNPRKHFYLTFGAHWSGHWNGGYQCGHQDDDRHQVLWDHPPEHLAQANWTVTLHLTETNNSEAAIKQLVYSAPWGESDWGVISDRSSVQIKKNMGGVTHFPGRTVCMHFLTDSGVSELQGDFHRYLAHWWNHRRNADDSGWTQTVTTAPQCPADYEVQLRTLIDKEYRSLRENMVRGLLGAVQSGAVAQFQNALLLLDHAVYRLQAFAHCIGIDLAQAPFTDLVNSATVRHELQAYLQGDALDLQLTSVTQALAAPYPLEPITLNALNRAVLPASHPKGLLRESVRCLSAHRVWKNMIRTVFPVLVEAIDLRNYYAQSVLLLQRLYHDEARAWYQELLTEVVGFARALFVIQHPHSHPLDNNYYREAHLSFHRWATEIAKSSNATACIHPTDQDFFRLSRVLGQRIAALASLDDLTALTLESAPSRTAVLFNEKLKRSWLPNVGLLLQILWHIDDQEHWFTEADDAVLQPEQVVNFALWYDGAYAFFKLLTHPDRWVWLQTHSEETRGQLITQELATLQDLIQTGHILQKSLRTMGLAKNYFATLFAGYKLLLADLKVLIKHRLDQDDSDFRVFNALCHGNNNFQAVAKAWLERLQVYALLIHSSVSMALGYDLQAVGEADWLSEKFALLKITPEEMLALLAVERDTDPADSGLLVRMARYENAIDVLYQAIDARLDRALSLAIFKSKLEHYFSDPLQEAQVVCITPDFLGRDKFVRWEQVDLVDQMLLQYPQVNELQMREMTIAISECEVLADSLANHHASIQFLSLVAVGLQTAALYCLYPALRQLIQLDLSHNEIAEETPIELPQEPSPLRRFMEQVYLGSVQALNMSHNQLSIDNVTLVTAAILLLPPAERIGDAMNDPPLRRHSTLFIDVTANPIEAEQLTEISEQLLPEDALVWGVPEQALQAMPVDVPGFRLQRSTIHLLAQWELGQPKLDRLLFILQQQQSTLFRYLHQPRLVQDAPEDVVEEREMEAGHQQAQLGAS